MGFTYIKFEPNQPMEAKTMYNESSTFTECQGNFANPEDRKHFLEMFAEEVEETPHKCTRIKLVRLINPSRVSIDSACIEFDCSRIRRVFLHEQYYAKHSKHLGVLVETLDGKVFYSEDVFDWLRSEKYLSHNNPAQ